MIRSLHNHRFDTIKEAALFVTENYTVSLDEAYSFVLEECFQLGTDTGIWINTYRFVTNA